MQRVAWPVAVLALGLGCAADDPGTRDGATTGDASSVAGTDADPDGDTAPSSSASGDTTTSLPTGGADTTGGDPVDPPGDPPIDAPEVYPPGRTHSPVTPWVADRLRDIAMARADRYEDVFMKVGASSTVSPSTLYCFASDVVDLGEHAPLDPTLQYFLGGEASGSTPFDRDTLAAEAGRTASWAIEGDPSPLQEELDLLHPRVALVHYGANDMGQAASYGAALQAFFLSMSTLHDTLAVQGVVPIVFGITRRGDNATADRWVGTFNAALRGLAQSRQTPFVDLHHAIDPLPGNGLGPDGLHLEAYPGGACILDEVGLEHGYNMRNLVALEALDRATAILVDDVDALDDPAESRPGSGTRADPIEIDPAALPFADARDTARIGRTTVDAYGCGTRDESGPEVWYRLELPEDQRLRIVVLDREGVDVDVQLLDATGDPGAGCVERDDRLLEAPLQAGVWHIVVDTWSGADGPLPGPYLLLVVPCEPGDPACD